MRIFIRRTLIALAILLVLGGIVFYLASRPDVGRLSTAELSGRVPVIASPRAQTVPTVRIPAVAGWPDGAAPTAAVGLAVNRFADGLDHPRSMLVLPNGDVLVAESRAQSRPPQGLTGRIEKALMNRAGAGGVSADRITLLRDSDGDGVADVRAPYITSLRSPYGMALVGDTLYVANTDALLAFPYDATATRMTAKPRKLAPLPAGGTNRHWTKSLIATADGKQLLVGVGADSNIGEAGMDREMNRAAVLTVDPATGANRVLAGGLRNPVGLAVHPRTGKMWTAVNERDMLGSDSVPDYLTEFDFGDFFGWPWYYWGGFVDGRVEPDTEDRRQYVRRPDYALGAHVAPLGIGWSDGHRLGSRWDNGLFIALHGSWNRMPVAGYTVVFVAFDDAGRPRDALPLTILDGFLAADGQSARGRPADVKVARDGALLVADDSGNMIWRVSAVQR